MTGLLYDEYDFAKIKTAKQLARFILNITERDGEIPYGEMLDCIDDCCRFVKRNKTKQGRQHAKR